MSKSKEYISNEPGWQDAWVCFCKNTVAGSGFYPCDKNGNEMEPNIGSDWANLYVCADCGRIINQETLEVVGQKSDPETLV